MRICVRVIAEERRNFMKIKKIIFFEHAVETLGYFSHQLSTAFEELGYESLFLDFSNLDCAKKQIREFYQPNETCVITFNFIAFSKEPDFSMGNGQTIWELLSIPSYNILVDHPLYYYKAMSTMSENMTILCIDRLHLSFVSRYYPFHKRIGFLPLAGTKQSLGAPQPLSSRKYPLIFTANYVPPLTLENALTHTSKDYREFYDKIIAAFLKEPHYPLDELFEQYLCEEFPEITIGESLASMHGMLFIDLYIRTYFRREIVHTIANHRFPILLVGKDWELSGCRHPEYMICTGMVDSATCLSYMNQSMISLNVMPWFKDGAHDRIFNAMLQGCVSLTDTTPYLDENFTNQQDFLTYSLEHLEELPDTLCDALANPKKLQEIADHGYEKALHFHTWKSRAKQLHHIIQTTTSKEKIHEYQ